MKVALVDDVELRGSHLRNVCGDLMAELEAL